MVNRPTLRGNADNEGAQSAPGAFPQGCSKPEKGNSKSTDNASAGRRCPPPPELTSPLIRSGTDITKGVAVEDQVRRSVTCPSNFAVLSSAVLIQIVCPYPPATWDAHTSVVYEETTPAACLRRKLLSPFHYGYWCVRHQRARSDDGLTAWWQHKLCATGVVLYRLIVINV